MDREELPPTPEPEPEPTPEPPVSRDEINQLREQTARAVRRLNRAIKRTRERAPQPPPEPPAPAPAPAPAPSRSRGGLVDELLGGMRRRG